MNTNLDCIIIGNKDYSVKERLFAVGNDKTAQRCTRRQYINYENHYYYYNEFFSFLKMKKKTYSLEKEYKKGHLTLNEMAYLPPICLTSFLKKNKMNVECVAYFDAEISRLKELINQKPLTVVISSSSYSNSFPIIKIIEFIRSLDSSIKIIVSGEYLYNKWATSSEKDFYEAIRIIAADFYVIEIPGEKAIFDLIYNIKENNTLYNIKNVFCLKNNEILFNGFEDKSIDLDSDMLKWNNIDKNLFSSIMNIKTSKGCPFNCSFCNFPIKNRKYLLSGIDTIQIQLDQLKKMGVKTIIFGDDTLNVPQDRFKDLCRMMIRNNYSFEWFSYFRIKESDEETYKLMKESGCKGVFLGIESANNSILKNMNKNTTVEDFKEGLRLLNKYDILSFAFILVGFPGETKETVENTIKFIEENNVTFFTANLWYADVTTPIYKHKDHYGLKGRDFAWEHNTTNHIHASDLADYMLQKITKSVWVPNENFGFQGVAYLLNKGLSLDLVKELLINAKTLVQRNITGEKIDDSNVVERMSKIINII